MKASRKAAAKAGQEDAWRTCAARTQGTRTYRMTLNIIGSRGDTKSSVRKSVMKALDAAGFTSCTGAADHVGLKP